MWGYPATASATADRGRPFGHAIRAGAITLAIAMHPAQAWARATGGGDIRGAGDAIRPALPAGTQAGATANGNIVVTAQRRAEDLRAVPISITSYSQKLMDQQGIRQIEDISRLTPSLRFTRTAGVAGNNGTNISIRGIASDVGSATTAIYIDDTPIQIRSIGYFSGNPYPRIFDLDRVEVLRGPQGTLFGAGAEGGAVRFLTPQPSFEELGIYARAEGSSTRHGASNHEAGLAVGGAVGETLAVRASGWYRRDGGYIDRDDPTGATRLGKDINSSDTYAAKLALSWRPAPEVTITPSIYYQKIESGGRNQSWEQRNDAGNGDYRTGIYNREPSRDTFSLPALTMRYDVGGHLALISTTSYFHRDQAQVLDYATYLSSLRTTNPFGAYASKDTGNATAAQTVGQRNVTQEVRLQSFSSTSLIDWTVGGYYARARQAYENRSESGRVPGVLSSGFPQYLGRYNLYDNVRAKDEQIAGFASVDVKPFDGVKVTLGARVTHSTFDYTQVRDGPTNSGRRTIFGAGQKDNSITPRIAISYQADPDTLVYASAAKGFRQGGAQGPVDPGFCGADLATLGLTDSPQDYRSDSLWSYEVGARNRLFGGRLSVDVNAYHVRWKNIQQSIRLPRCAFSFIDNLGEATGRGMDVAISVTPVRALTLGGNIGYNKTTYDHDVLGGNGLLIRQEGDRIGGPKLTGSAFGEATFPLDAGARTTAYLRGDYSFASRDIRANPRTFGYDPGLPGLGATGYLTARAGVRRGGFDVSLFVNNVTNAHDPLSRSHDAIGSPLYYVETYRPRTIGLTGQFRY